MPNSRGGPRTREKKRTKIGGALVHISPTSAAVAFDGEDLSEWDDTELLRGRRRNPKTGKFHGHDPQVVPHRLVQELTKRRMSRAAALMSYSVTDAVKLLRAVVRDEEADLPLRMEAAKQLLDRVLGRPREAISLDVHGSLAPWQAMAADSIVRVVPNEAAATEPEPEVGIIIDPEPEPEPRAKTFWKNQRGSLTDEDAEAIRATYRAGGVTQPELADRFGVSKSQIYRVLRGSNHAPKKGRK